MNNHLNIVKKIDYILDINHTYYDTEKTYKWFKSYKGKNLSFIYKLSYADYVEMYDEHGITKIKNDGFGIAFVNLNELSKLFN